MVEQRKLFDYVGNFFVIMWRKCDSVLRLTCLVISILKNFKTNVLQILVLFYIILQQLMSYNKIHRSFVRNQIWGFNPSQGLRESFRQNW